MLCNVKYVYDRTKEEKNVLLGAKLYLYDGKRTRIQEIYVGLPFVLEDILESNTIARLLKISDKESFAKRYKELNASGIIYFPQTDEHYFLEDGDEVLLWNGEDKIESMLEERIDEYRNQVLDQSTQEKIATRKDALRDLEPDNSLAELYDYSLMRQRYSSK